MARSRRDRVIGERRLAPRPFFVDRHEGVEPAVDAADLPIMGIDEFATEISRSRIIAAIFTADSRVTRVHSGGGGLRGVSGFG